jgi:hypothetical protein
MSLGGPVREPGDPRELYSLGKWPARIILLLLYSKKPLIDFGRFFIYNIYRERNKKANWARYIKQKI